MNLKATPLFDKLRSREVKHLPEVTLQSANKLTTKTWDLLTPGQCLFPHYIQRKGFLPRMMVN